MAAGTEARTAAQTDPVLAAQRQRALLRRIRDAGASHVNELTRATGASASTVRRDLVALERQGLIERVRGGAQALTAEPERGLREVSAADEKRRIGEAAAQLIHAGSTLLVLGGTTTESLVPFLPEVPDLTVLTNSLAIADLLSRSPEVDLVVLGGVLRRDEMSLLGHLTVENLADFDVDLVFSSAFGVDPDVGVTGINLLETQTDRALISVAPVVLLVDHSKFEQRGPVKLVQYDALEAVVTDGPLAPSLAERLAGHSPRLIVA